jgi:hypothetical protein
MSKQERYTVKKIQKKGGEYMDRGSITLIRGRKETYLLCFLSKGEKESPLKKIMSNIVQI